LGDAAGNCTPGVTSGCFIDAFLSDTASTTGKDGYMFTVTATASAYTSLAAPVNLNTTGTRSFCSDQSVHVEHEHIYQGNYRFSQGQ